ncbi:MAG TPA: FtsX-like permease family protein [Rhizomicrobium sp.]|nr:FtsX-like permease family protein [Rhizomicrobium sp.]
MKLLNSAEWGLGLRFLGHNPLRLAAALSGVAVAVVIMFVELGLLLGVLNSQAMVASRLDADLVVMNRARVDLHKWTNVDGIRLNQIAAEPDVAQVIPIYQGTMGFRNPPDLSIRRIVIFAFPANEVPFDIGNPEKISNVLRIPGSVLFDRLSRPIYGEIRRGQDVELDGTLFRMAGFVSLGPDVVNDGAVVMSEGDWLSRHPNDQPIMGAVRLRPGTDVHEARARILAALPDDVIVMTPDEVRSREFAFTLKAAPIGILFGIGMLAGLVIGAITCYQILFNEIVDRFAEYATLRAMGFSSRFFRRVILEQAAFLSLGGFLAGAALTWIAYLYLAYATSLAVGFDVFSSVFVLMLTVGMTVMAGLFALRPVAEADPASLY